MEPKQGNKKLRYLHPDCIQPNPENPRIIFRQEEMENLMISISRLGVQVPISVYQDGNKFVLLDGERRWRCAKKLNLKEIPALVQDKPTDLQNLLLMYNIHALREQWDYFTIAINLQRIIDLFQKERNYKPNEIELSEETGLTRGQIRRCNLLLNLPERYKSMLMEELQLPKSQQKLSEDLFIEMERSLKTVVKRMPEFEDEIENIRDSLINKFRDGTIGAVTDFRQLSKIATAIDNIGLRHEKAREILRNIFSENNNVGIKDIYRDSVEFEYDERKACQLVESLNEYFDDIFDDRRQVDLDNAFIAQLRELYKRIKELLGED